ncbi:hypothetical protein F4560_004654 [Saccharothrix ecbatanensis]|uniref:Uncharacterized protein n=1 Tax=Saccharothrix ecbatanensis TaxID=1105145 RepID=A0A7W9HMJ8_9PSEU|nr:hypothetical protein [Saccharothrix ecbatanensis]
MLIRPYRESDHDAVGEICAPAFVAGNGERTPSR